MSEIKFGPKMAAAIHSARKTYTDAIEAATTADQTDNAFLAYTRAIGKVVDEIANVDGDNPLAKARREYLADMKMAASRNEATDIRRKYESGCTAIIMGVLKRDAMADRTTERVVVKQNDAGPHQAVVREVARQDAAPVPQPRVISVERRVEPAAVFDDKPPPVPAPAPKPAPATDAQAQYDQRITNAWRKPPPDLPKAKKRPTNVFIK